MGGWAGLVGGWPCCCFSTRMRCLSESIQIKHAAEPAEMRSRSATSNERPSRLGSLNLHPKAHVPLIQNLLVGVLERVLEPFDLLRHGAAIGAGATLTSRGSRASRISRRSLKLQLKLPHPIFEGQHIMRMLATLFRLAASLTLADSLRTLPALCLPLLRFSPFLCLPLLIISRVMAGLSGCPSPSKV